MPAILVVDDDHDFHTIAAAFIERVGCQALHAFDGEEGEKMALANKPDLILLDIMMPEQDGYTTCQHLRIHGYLGAISMLSAILDATGTKKVRECGANGYLMKPLASALLSLHVEYARSGMSCPTVSEWLDHQP